MSKRLQEVDPRKILRMIGLSTALGLGFVACGEDIAPKTDQPETTTTVAEGQGPHYLIDKNGLLHILDKQGRLAGVVIDNIGPTVEICPDDVIVQGDLPESMSSNEDPVYIVDERFCPAE